MFVCVHMCVPACTPSAQMRKERHQRLVRGVTSPTVFGVSGSVFNPGQRDTEVRPFATETNPLTADS